MDGDWKFSPWAILVGIAHQANKDKGQKQRGQEIKGAVLVTGDAVVGAQILARQFQVDFVVAGDIADVLVLEHLEPRAKPHDHAAPDALTGLLEDAVRGFGRVADG